MRLGIDIGGTKTEAALVTDAGTVAGMRSAPSGRGARGVVDVAVGLAREVVSASGQHGRGGVADGFAHLKSVGACMPGLVDPTTGTARHAVNLGVESLDLAAELGRALGRPVVVENDVKAAALGARALVRATTWSRLAYLNLGTGLAAAVVVDGIVVRGVDGIAGEIGHLPVGGDVPCTCGQVGCLETIASGSALARLWPAGAATVADPFAAATAGDTAAAVAGTTLCRGVGLAIQLLVLASGADHVVIGGGVTSLGQPLAQGIRQDLTRRGESSRILKSLDLAGRFELLPVDVPVAAIGAACLAPLQPLESAV